MKHMFKVGQVVQPRSVSQKLPHDRFRILRLLPSTAGGMPLYCIRNDAEMIERVVEQNDIEAA
ncbi:hypothetical protein [Microvirga flocculans]|nr:hypothetical protein [Microvirga flocculans]